MRTPYFISMDDVKDLPVEEAFKVVIDGIYPSLFNRLTDIASCVSKFEAGEEFSTLTGMVQRMNTELEGMYQKEKLVLFPYILKLKKENKISDSCKPFNNIKAHYKSLMHTLEGAKKFCHEFVEKGDDCDLTEKINSFEKLLVPFQHMKDKSLYLKYKNCGKCCGGKE
ncbi:MAG: hypothetical protein WAT19_14730 [Ferruginibacter sp.]